MRWGNKSWKNHDQTRDFWTFAEDFFRARKSRAKDSLNKRIIDFRTRRMKKNTVQEYFLNKNIEMILHQIIPILSYSATSVPPWLSGLHHNSFPRCALCSILISAKLLDKITFAVDLMTSTSPDSSHLSIHIPSWSLSCWNMYPQSLLEKMLPPLIRVNSCKFHYLRHTSTFSTGIFFNQLELCTFSMKTFHCQWVKILLILCSLLPWFYRS